MNILNALARLRDDIKTWVANNINSLNTKIDNKLDSGALPGAIANKVDKVEGKNLSTNDFTNEYKAKLDALQQVYFLSTNISLFADRWVGDSSPYSQVVTVNGINNNSKIDLCPTIDQLISMSEYGISLVAMNDNSVVTVYAFNNKPISDFDMQVTVTDVTTINIPNAEGVGF